MISEENKGNGAKKKTPNLPTLNTGFTTYNPLSLGYVPSIETVNIANGNAFAQNALANEVNKQHAANGFGLIVSPSKNNAVSAFDPTTLPNTKVLSKVQNAKNNSGGGAGGGVSTPSVDYQGMLDNLYNKVMGYGGFSYSQYTPSVYTKTVDTSGIENQLKGWLGEIDNYNPFSYDLNGDLLYKQMADNYVQQGQLAMQDAMGQAAALTGGYGNSYASAVGNQAYQNYLTQLNNNIPELQQQALNVWQAGYDQLLNQYSAGSAHLNDLLALEQNYFDIWNANEQNAFNAWNANQQLALGAWQAGYNQLMDQYNLGVDYINQLQAMQAQKGSGGGSSGGSSNKKNTNTKIPTAQVAAGALAGLGATSALANLQTKPPAVTNPYTAAQLEELLKLNGK